MSARTSEQPIIQVNAVHKAFGAVKVLQGMSLSVAAGQAICVIGPSGSGKSTLLRCINGLLAVDRGEIFVADYAVHRLKSDQEMIALRKEVSIVFQQYNLFPHKTALENIMMAPVQVLGQPKDEVRARFLSRCFEQIHARSHRLRRCLNADRQSLKRWVLVDPVMRTFIGGRYF